ncbi:MAG: hypothetical protein JXA54_06605 [Candidatus Heimdallarchaeota archaeon]|nr:hypothetical protein [Candidatus Heimdallarchaeota archaeon]
MVHLWLSYPKELDLPVISHNIILGVYGVSPTNPSNIVGNYLHYVLGTIFGINILLLIIQKKRKGKL